MSADMILHCPLGRMDYTAAWRLQLRLQDRMIQARRSAPPELLPHFFLTVEHPHVFTLGKSGKAANLLVSEQELAKKGATLVQSDRGGDITYHGPGQLVGYPIMDMERLFKDIGRYLRTLEEVIIRTCADYDLSAHRSAGETGVWLGHGENRRKICAMGVRLSRWVTMHGFALNINTDLRYFDFMIPCGIRNAGVTSLAVELGHTVDSTQVRNRLLRHFADLFELDLSEWSEGVLAAFPDPF